MLEIASAGNVVIMRRDGQMLLQGIGHALRVFVGAPLEFSVRREIQEGGGLSEDVELRTITRTVRRSDRQKMRWLEYLFAVDWREPTLYDLMINTEVLSVDAAADLVLSALSQSERTTSEISQQALRDRALAFRFDVLSRPIRKPAASTGSSWPIMEPCGSRRWHHWEEELKWRDR